jgi:replicative DNA helicase
MAIADGATQSKDAEGAADLTREALERIDRRASGEGLTGYKTGFADLDALLFGLQPGQLVVLGARPGVGKTALALSVALNLTRAGVPVLFFSLEMPTAEIMDRAISSRSGVPLSDIRRGRINDDQSGRILSAGEQLKRERFWIDDRSDLTASRLAAVTRRNVRRNGVRVVVVDYLQLMTPENARENRTQQVGLCARRAKMIARECGVPVLMLAQLNRELENREGGRPRLADLRDSGEIEQHADVAIFLHPHKGSEAEPVWQTDVIVAKNRNGPIGETTLGFRRPNTRFENFQPEPKPEDWCNGKD